MVENVHQMYLQIVLEVKVLNMSDNSKKNEQNGVAEKMNLTLVESVHCVLSDSKLPKQFWAEALAAAVYVKNRSPTTALKDQTPYEGLIGLKPSVKHLKKFGCVYYAHVPKDESKNLILSPTNVFFLGNASESKEYRVYDFKKKCTVLGRDVVFKEFERLAPEKECDILVDNVNDN